MTDRPRTRADVDALERQRAQLASEARRQRDEAVARGDLEAAADAELRLMALARLAGPIAEMARRTVANPTAVFVKLGGPAERI